MKYVSCDNGFGNGVWDGFRTLQNNWAWTTMTHLGWILISKTLPSGSGERAICSELKGAVLLTCTTIWRGGALLRKRYSRWLILLVQTTIHILQSVFGSIQHPIQGCWQVLYVFYHFIIVIVGTVKYDLESCTEVCSGNDEITRGGQSTSVLSLRQVGTKHSYVPLFALHCVSLQQQGTEARKAKKQP